MLNETRGQTLIVICIWCGVSPKFPDNTIKLLIGVSNHGHAGNHVSLLEILRASPMMTPWGGIACVQDPLAVPNQPRP